MTWLAGPHLFTVRPESSQAVELHPAVAAVLLAAEGCHRTDGDLDAVFQSVATLQVAVADWKAARVVWEGKT